MIMMMRKDIISSRPQFNLALHGSAGVRKKPISKTTEMNA
jgi:hypothetical protein